MSDTISTETDEVLEFDDGENELEILRDYLDHRGEHCPQEVWNAFDRLQTSVRQSDVYKKLYVERLERDAVLEHVRKYLAENSDSA